MSFLRKLRGERTHKEIDLYQCGDCKSLYNPSGYKEDNIALLGDTWWHINEFSHTTTFARDLIKRMKELNPGANSILDIGAGIGSLLSVSREFRLDTEGVEPNPFAVLYGKRELSLDITCSYFHSKLFDKKFDLITIISVLEHLEDPRSLFEEAIKSLNKNGLLFVNMPLYIPESHRQYLKKPDLEGSIFTVCDVHILHFTEKGFKKMANDFQATFIEKILGGFIVKFN